MHRLFELALVAVLLAMAHPSHAEETLAPRTRGGEKVVLIIKDGFICDSEDHGRAYLASLMALSENAKNDLPRVVLVGLIASRNCVAIGTSPAALVRVMSIEVTREVERLDSPTGLVLLAGTIRQAIFQNGAVGTLTHAESPEAYFFDSAKNFDETLARGPETP